MSELQRYVNALFAHYRDTKQIKDLKEEILGNLEARKTDLMAAGADEAEAISKAKQSITSADGLIDGNKEIFINQLWREWLQWVLIYLLSACIVSVPMLLFHIGTPLSTLLFLAAALAGILYLRFNSKAFGVHFEKRTYISLPRVRRIRNLVWIFWAAFTLMYTAATTAMYFGSNIWFSRRVSIDGPYQLAVVLILYAVPFFTVILPLAVHKIPSLVLKYEVQSNEETE